MDRECKFGIYIRRKSQIHINLISSCLNISWCLYPMAPSTPNSVGVIEIQVVEIHVF